jgi:FemAB-related protein (PEP-CTERM system-associated)
MNSSNSVITIKKYTEADKNNWDDYVMQHSQGTLYHLAGWKNVIEKTYSHKTYYLIAVQSTSQPPILPASQLKVVGILPLVHLKHFLFGNTLVSMPFFDMGGILADNNEIEKALLYETVKLCQKLKVQSIELRHTEPLPWLNESSMLKAQSSKLNSTNYELSATSHELSTMSHQPSAISYATKSHKVRMLLDLPDSSEKLIKSFKSKLRSQIRKPIKEGLKPRIGGLELLDDFYDVFSKNMRDLGSPVHSKQLMKNVLEEFPDKAKIVIIYKENNPIASSLIVGFKRILENPWSSALREYSSLSPNMLLYWTMIEYACDHGYSPFDFGRSSPDEGTYKFKKQWGAEPETLHWHYLSLNGNVFTEETPEKSKFARAIQYWKKLPVSITKFIGPSIRKYIGL